MKTRGEPRWDRPARYPIQCQFNNESFEISGVDLFWCEIQADSLHNRLAYYLRKGESPPLQKLKIMEANASILLGFFRSILGKTHWLGQYQLSYWDRNHVQIRVQAMKEGSP